MFSRFPAIEPYHHFLLPVDEPHEIYVEECGNPDGLPVIFVHGGPGVGCFETDRCFFDPSLYRIILFEQRGVGRSVPHASLEKNTTQYSIADMEAIREKLGVDQWIVFGGSWGSTLSLAYAQTHPDRVKGLIVRGIFLLRPEEIDWFYGAKGAANIFPDYYEDYLEPLAKDRRDNVIEAYHELLTGDNELSQMQAAKAWSIWEGRCCTLNPNPDLVERFDEPHRALSLARIETHYFINNGFFTPNQLLNDMDKIAHIPGVIVHGRYDVICPVKNAWDIHKRWPKSELKIIREAGHGSGEPGITDQLIKATNAFASEGFFD
jgi:proline iminopeptidase